MTDRDEQHRWQRASFQVEDSDGGTRWVTVLGRTRWALECLMAAGERGCTPIDAPGPRWSDYVFKLRGEGLDIETIAEKHDGPFAGTHARYVLRSVVIPAVAQEVAA